MLCFALIDPMLLCCGFGSTGLSARSWGRGEAITAPGVEKVNPQFLISFVFETNKIASFVTVWGKQAVVIIRSSRTSGLSVYGGLIASFYQNMATTSYNLVQLVNPYSSRPGSSSRLKKAIQSSKANENATTSSTRGRFP